MVKSLLLRYIFSWVVYLSKFRMASIQIMIPQVKRYRSSINNQLIY